MQYVSVTPSAMLRASGFSLEEVNQWFSHIKSELDNADYQQEL
ncbi:Uncharacterised protein [Yersinia enterocolitica]|nr:Uncharacterised protein [Yersinia enterocolitica]